MSKTSVREAAITKDIRKHWVNVDIDGEYWSIRIMPRRRRTKCKHIFVSVANGDIKAGWRRACRKCGAFAR